MKKLWLICGLCCVWFSGVGQGLTPPPPLPSGSYLSGEEILSHIYSMDINYHHITQYAKIYSDSFPNDEHFAKRYGRWNDFWSPRVDASGEFDATYRNMMNVLYNYPVCGGDDADWEQTGPIINTQNSGVIVTVASPQGQSNIIYAGSNTGGLWKTKNASAGINTTWKNVTDVLGVPGLGVNDIIINPDNPNTLYIATGFNYTFIPQNYGSGVWKSTNSGNTWVKTDLTWDPINTTDPREVLAINKLAFHPDDTTIIYALARFKVYKMTNSGNANLSPDNLDLETLAIENLNHSTALQYDPTTILGESEFIDIEFIKTPANTFTMFVSSKVKDYNYGRLFKSTDDGNTWTHINIPSPPTSGQNSVAHAHNNGMITCLIESAMDDNNHKDKLYVHYIYTNNFTSATDYIAPLYEYDDDAPIGINPWRLLNPNNSGSHQIEPEYPNFEVNPKDANVMYFPGQQLGKLIVNNISGNTFTTLTPILSFANSAIHSDHRDLMINFNSINGSYELIIGNDGGVSIATPTATNYSFTTINGIGNTSDRLIAMQCTDISISNNVAGIDKVILGGAIDNANYIKNNDNFEWTNFAWADGGQTAINEAYNLVYIRKNHQLLIYDATTLAHKDYIEPYALVDQYSDFAEIKIDRSNPDLFYVGKLTRIKQYQIEPNSNFNIINTPVSDFDFSTLGITFSNGNNPSISCFELTHNNPDNMLLAFKTGT